MERTPGIVSLMFGAAPAAALDETAFRVLYDATAQPLRAYLLHICRRPDVADDVLQETFCRYLMHRRSDMDESQTRSYLFRIATNLVRDRARSGMDVPVPETVPELRERGPAPNPETRLDVRSALRQLRPRERELLWLAYVEGMNHEEIAAATGLRPLSIRILLFRARRKAAQLLTAGKAPGAAQKRFA